MPGGSPYERKPSRDTLDPVIPKLGQPSQRYVLRYRPLSKLLLCLAPGRLCPWGWRTCLKRCDAIAPMGKLRENEFGKHGGGGVQRAVSSSGTWSVAGRDRRHLAGRVGLGAGGAPPTRRRGGTSLGGTEPWAQGHGSCRAIKAALAPAGLRRSAETRQR